MAQAVTRHTSPPPVDPDASPSDGRWGLVCVAYLILAAVGAVAMLIHTWPVANENAEVCAKLLGGLREATERAADKDQAAKLADALRRSLEGRGLACAPELQRLGWLGERIDKDQALLILVAIAGMLGSLVYCLRSATWYLGNREFRRSWAYWYFAQPFIGAALGAMVYLVLRAGFISPSSGAAVNPFGFLAVAGVVGLYTEQALSQLKLVAETILRAPPKGRNATRHERPGERRRPGSGGAQPGEGGEESRGVPSQPP